MINQVLTSTRQENVQKRGKLLNKIFIGNVILSAIGFLQLYVYIKTQSTCKITGWLKYFSLLIDCLMAASVFIFLLIKNSYRTKNFFLFVLMSNIQIVYRFIYLNEIITAQYDFRIGDKTNCWVNEQNIVWQLVKTMVQIGVYYILAKMTADLIQKDFQFKFSHKTGFINKNSNLITLK